MKQITFGNCQIWTLHRRKCFYFVSGAPNFRKKILCFLKFVEDTSLDVEPFMN